MLVNGKFCFSSKFQAFISKNVGEDRFLNSKNVHFRENVFKVRARTVTTRIFRI